MEYWANLGIISNEFLIQAKGLEYRLVDLLKDSEKSKLYDGGIFITIYLAPYNYHRIHSMVSGEVREFCYVPGDLYGQSALLGYIMYQNFLQEMKD